MLLPQGRVQSDFETELRNLSILRLLRHPNIIKILGSFLYQSELSLIFLRARGGSLRDLFKGPRPEDLKSDRSILIALSGLCSAVCAVHQFVSSKYKLELIGCHHDLKPENVLVEGSTFLLADFGLSRFKEPSDTSETPRRVVHPVYTAPECCAVEGDAGNPLVHRSSDIWSLGCIITEVVTYMRDGAEGITAFREQRKHKESNFVLYRFHRGGTEHPAITTWINERQQSDLRTQQLISQLVGEMLRLAYQDRPRAQEVEAKMHFIALDAICQEIDKLYQDVCTKADSDQPKLERTTFDSWRDACGILEFPEVCRLRQWTESVSCAFLYETLKQLQNELVFVLDNCVAPNSRVYGPLRQLNNLLIDSLSQAGQERAHRYLDRQILLTSSDIELTALMESQTSDGGGPSQAQRLSILAAVKCMTEMLRERPAHSGRIERTRLKRKKRVGDFKIEYLEGDDGDDNRRQVVVESKMYEGHLGDPKTASELQERLEQITELLKQASRATGRDCFRVLKCAGFYQEPSAYNCGLVYEFPDSSKELSFITLRSALVEKQPPLEQRFQLAQALADSVMKFHTVSWLQKSISSFNVAFFHPKDESWLSSIANPFFLGFLYSRNDDNNAFTEGPTDDAHHRDYQHPDYRSKQNAGKNAGRNGELRYRIEYDYYSLGLVLLEIGMWIPLSQILERINKHYHQPERSSPARSSTSELDRLLAWVERLKYIMGSRYYEVVDTCLRGTFTDPTGLADEAESRHLIVQSFANRVVDRLAQCNA